MDADALAEFLAAEGGFGPLQRRSGRLLNEVSHAQITGAENLLTKAARSLSGGDAERAERLIDRAAQMPYDPREEGPRASAEPRCWSTASSPTSSRPANPAT